MLENVSAELPEAFFISDFSTATGMSNAALRDTNKAVPWTRHTAGTGGGTGLEVVTTASTGRPFPSQNVLLVRANHRTGGVVAEHLMLGESTGTGPIPIPAVGETLSYRWYQSVEVPNSIDAAGGAPHPIQNGTNASVNDWMHEMTFNLATANPPVDVGAWRRLLSFAGGGNVSPNNRWDPVGSAPFIKGIVYRIEVQIERVSGGFYPHARVYNSDDELLYDDTNIFNADGAGATSLATLAAPLALDADPNFTLSRFQIGNNGPSWNTLVSGQFPFLMYYQGCFAIRLGDWCNAYGSLAGETS